MPKLIEPPVEPMPETLSSATENLRIAAARFVEAFAESIRPVLVIFREAGLIDDTGQLTPKGKKMMELIEEAKK